MKTFNPLRLLNPLIWLINKLRYFSHLESQRYLYKYEPYNFDNDLRYFK